MLPDGCGAETSVQGRSRAEDGVVTGLLKRICAEDREALDLIDGVEKNPDGNPTGANQYQSGTVDNVNRTSRPDGNTRQHALRKLRTGRPDLHARRA